MFFGRLGYTTAFQRDKDFRSGKAAWGGLTVGAGATYEFAEGIRGSLDYGFVNLGESLGSTHRFSLGIQF